MRCIYCNSPLTDSDYCPKCGADISIQKRIGRISNLLYNDGLEKAMIRDMDGAITCLNRSLKFNKENTDARNLLGLCYYETGEAISALCEWVISKNLQQEDNLADYYIDELQNNKNRLETINQALVKYNQSVTYCRENNEDMAVIQLKKVINRNPKFVKAYQLLALLYMKRSEYERARRLLRKASQIDATNTTTLRYLQEVEEVTGKTTALARRRRREEPEEEEEETVSGTLRYLSGNETIIQPTTFRDSSTVATFINIILGILLGGAIVWFLVVPSNRQSINNTANRQVTDANSKLAAVQVQANELQGEIDGYVEQAEEAESERDEALDKAQNYDELMSAANQYILGNSTQAADEMINLNADLFDGNAKELYDALSGSVASGMFAQYYNEGTNEYAQEDYKAAAEDLEKAIDLDPDREQPDHYNAMLYLGMSYYYLGETTRSDKVFNDIINYYPEYESVVQGYITSNGTQENTAADTLDLSGLGDAATAGSANTGTANAGTAGTGTADAQSADAQADAYAADTGTADAGTADTWTDDVYGADTYGADTYGADTYGVDTYGADTYGADAYAADAGTANAGDGITIYDNGGTSSTVVWTDPTTGLSYDANGNLVE